jgi:hypothetical protein
VRVRTLGFIAAVLCAVAVLSGCQSKIGAAAIVGGHTITETKVSGLVTPDSKPFTPSGGTDQIVPKAYALQTLIQTQIFTAQLASIGVHPTAADQLAAATTALQGATTADETKLLAGYGFSNSFGPLYVQSLALLQIVEDHAVSTAQQSKASDFFAKFPVNVNPRYGKWSGANLSIDAAGPPAFLTSDQ